MPTYEFECKDCGHHFEIFASMSEREKGLKCPKCGGFKLNQIFGSFMIMGSSKGSDSSCSSCTSSSCSTCNIKK